MKKIKAWVFLMWRPIMAFVAIAIVIGIFFGFRLGSLAPGTSPAEQTYISSVTSGKQILKQPVFAVHRVPVYGLFKLHVHNIALYRAISAFCASLAVVSCFFILREWYTDRVAILGSWLFLTSAWMLHIGRLATPEVLYLLLMPLLWAATWLYNTTLRKSAFVVLSFLAGLSFYIPGFGLLLILSAVWQHKLVWKELRQIPWWLYFICTGIVLVLLVPLAWATVGSPGQLLLAIGLPDHVPHLSSLLRNFLNIPGYLFFKGPNDPTKWLGRLSLLDMFSIAMLIIGIYSMRYYMKLVRAQLLIGSTLLMVLLITLGGPVTITAIFPVIYILIAGGIAFMLQQWFAVFPYNPIARGIATTLMSLVILMVSCYHISHYFIAWPQTPATRASFRQSLLEYTPEKE